MKMKVKVKEVAANEDEIDVYSCETENSSGQPISNHCAMQMLIETINCIAINVTTLNGLL